MFLRQRVVSDFSAITGSRGHWRPAAVGSLGTSCRAPVRVWLGVPIGHPRIGGNSRTEQRKPRAGCSITRMLAVGQMTLTRSTAGGIGVVCIFAT